MYKILSIILLSRLTPYAEKVIGVHQCGFRRKSSTTDRTFCILQILEKKWGYNEAVHQLFIDIKNAYDSVMKEVLYNILTEFGIPMKLARLIKMCLNETYSRVWVGTHLSDMFPIRNGFKQGDALSPLLFNYVVEYAIRWVQVNQDGLKLNGTHRLPVYADDINIMSGNVHTIKKNTEVLVDSSKETGLEVNADKTKHISTSGDQNGGQSHSMKTDNSCFVTAGQFKYLGITLTYKNSVQVEIKSR